MEKKRRISTVIIAILVFLSLIGTAFLYGIDISELGNPENEEGLDGADPMAVTIWSLIAVSAGIVIIYFYAFMIILTNGICVIFSTRNAMKAPEKKVQITNCVLSVLNILLIIMPIIRLILWQLQ